MRSLVWLRADLRTTDNTALVRACEEADRGVIAVFLVAAEQWAAHDWAPVKVDFILRTLEVLRERLRRRNIPLLVRPVDRFDGAPDALLDLARRHARDALHFNREYELNEARRDEAVTQAFTRAGLAVRAYTDQVALAPGTIRTGTGGFYTVFTPFKRSWLARIEEAPTSIAPLGAPKKQAVMPIEPDRVPESVTGFDRAATRADLWPAGEEAAARRLATFVRHRLQTYHERRDFPEAGGTSALSPYLAVGALSPRRCLAAAAEVTGGRLDGKDGPGVWVSELVWREFYRHVLVGYPRVCRHRAFRPEYEAVRWRDDDDGFQAWCAGETGLPIVDAAMRQLLDTGWMHNRLRMVTAMFLSKNLLVDWRRGERHFMRHLIDGDLASNNGGWQWSASTGTDAAPYFRIFNPVTQGKRFDPDATFIRRYVPELADHDAAAAHEPWRHDVAPTGYPAPIVDLATSRVRAIDAFKAVAGRGEE